MVTERGEGRLLGGGVLGCLMMGMSYGATTTMSCLMGSHVRCCSLRVVVGACWGPGEALVDSRPLFLYQRNPSLLWRCRRPTFGGRKAGWVFFPNRGFPFLVWLARADKTASFGSGLYFVI
jgi:hypothetical protein